MFQPRGDVVKLNLFSLCRILFPVLLLAVAGCGGYQLAADQPSIVGDGTKTLKVKGVDHPTLEPELPYALRTSLRNEINARHMARWVDSGPADYEIQIKVISYTTREWMRSEDDKTLLYDSNLSLEAMIYDGKTNKEIWRSGVISYAERLEKPDDNVIAGDIVEQVMRRLADKMRSTF